MGDELEPKKLRTIAKNTLSLCKIFGGVWAGPAVRRLFRPSLGFLEGRLDGFLGLLGRRTYPQDR